MLKVRQGIFETNSSSSHSLSLGKPPSNTDQDISFKNVIEVGSEEYGWGYDILYDWYEKADYLGVQAVEDGVVREMLIGALKRKYPNAEIIFGEDGYIDHQSYGNGWDELSSEQEVYDFIFGSGTIEIDNDNH